MLGPIRKAGKFLLDKDAQYAARAERDMGGAHKAGIGGMLGAVPLREIPQDMSQMNLKEKAAASAVTAGVAATNVGYRYGLPAAGVTLAGKGLYDLTTQFGNEADYPESNSLTLR